MRKWPILSSTICGNARDGGDGIEGEAVAGVDFKARGGGEARSSREALQLAGNACGIAFERALAVGAGVQLDDRRADALGGFDRLRHPAR